MSIRIESRLPVDQVSQNQLEKMQACPGWHGDISSEEGRVRLEGKPPFTYLLAVGENHEGGKEDAYKLMWVMPEKSVNEKMIFLEYDLTGPYFRNTITESFPNGVMSDTDEIDEALLSKIMECDPGMMSPLHNV